MKRNSTLLLVVCCFVFLLTGCQDQKGSTVFCAASLTGVVEELSPSPSLRVHSGGSKNLLSQFHSGARADLFLLADASLSKSLPPELVQEEVVLAENRLVLARPRGGTASPGDLGKTGTVLALADPQSAPLGYYSRQALEGTEISARKVYLKDATAVLTAVRLGHAQLGVVYASDFQNWPELEEVAPLDNHDPIRYSAVLMKSAGPDAVALFEVLTSASGKEAFEKAGFTVLQ